jgi:RHS repeat-associated protein
LTSYNRDANFNDTSRTFPGGGDVRITLGNLQAPLKLTSSAGYANGVERWIGVDTVGRVDKHLGYLGNSGRFFQYDSLGRLRVAKSMSDNNQNPPPAGCPDPDYALVGTCFNPADWVVTGVPDTFAFDAAGNRTDKGGTYTTGNRITAFNGCTYATDNDGNVTSRVCGGVTTGFTWNAEGQLTDVTITGQPAVKHYYDAFGRLVRRDSGGAAAGYFLWDEDNLLAELGPSANSKIAEYSYYPGLDKLHALVVDTAAYYAHQDGLGNTIQLSKGTTVHRGYDYTEWGVLKTATSADLLPFNGKDRARWKGALWMGPDSTLYYMRNRWYETGSGRFLSEDPIGIDGGINRYSFAQNEPVSWNDPLGLAPCTRLVEESVDWGKTADGRLEMRVISKTIGWACDFGDLGFQPVFSKPFDSWFNPNNEYLGNFAGGTFYPVAKVSVPDWLVVGASPGLVQALKSTVKRSQNAEIVWRKIGQLTRATWRIPGTRDGHVDWYRVLNKDGRTIRLFKDVFDKTGRWLRRDPYP